MGLERRSAPGEERRASSPRGSPCGCCRLQSRFAPRPAPNEDSAVTEPSLCEPAMWASGRGGVSRRRAARPDGQFSAHDCTGAPAVGYQGEEPAGARPGRTNAEPPPPATNEPEPETPPPRTRGGGRTRAAGGGGDPQKRRSPSRTNAPQARTGQGANRGDDGPERRRSEPPGRATRQPRQNMWRSCCCYFVGVRAAWTDGAAVKPAQPVLFVLIPQKYLY